MHSIVFYVTEIDDQFIFVDVVYSLRVLKLYKNHFSFTKYVI